MVSCRGTVGEYAGNAAKVDMRDANRTGNREKLPLASYSRLLTANS
jgi:hypothetical protein